MIRIEQFFRPCDNSPRDYYSSFGYVGKQEERDLGSKVANKRQLSYANIDNEESSEPKGKLRQRSSNWRKSKTMTEESDIPEEDEREDKKKENWENRHAKPQVINQQPNTVNQSAAYPDFLAPHFQQQQQNQENSISKLLGVPQKGMNALGKFKTQQNYHSGMVNGQLNRQADLSGKISQQQQREILASILKQQHQHQQHLLHQAAAEVLLSRMQQPAIIQQPASPPTNLLRPISPRPPSPQSGMFQPRPRILSPLVFGQTPPLLSHAHAPVHPTQMMPNTAPNIPMNSNTLQVYNPSSQEFDLHTQQIIQVALKEKEMLRKRQDMERTWSPNVSSMGGDDSSPSKVSGSSSTMSTFTPTSVMREMQADKGKEMEKGEPMTSNSLFKPQVAKVIKEAVGGEQNVQNIIHLTDNISDNDPMLVINWKNEHQYVTAINANQDLYNDVVNDIGMPPMQGPYTVDVLRHRIVDTYMQGNNNIENIGNHDCIFKCRTLNDFAGFHARLARFADTEWCEYLGHWLGRLGTLFCISSAILVEEMEPNGPNSIW